MAFGEEITITNNTNNYKILLRGCDNWNSKMTQSTINIPFIDQPPQNNIIFKFSGQTEDVNFNFKLWDDGEDASDGTFGGISTIAQQITFLKSYVFSSEFDTTWTLVDDLYYPSGVTGIITGLSLNNKAGSPTYGEGSISFLRGKLLTL